MNPAKNQDAGTEPVEGGATREDINLQPRTSSFNSTGD